MPPANQQSNPPQPQKPAAFCNTIPSIATEERTSKSAAKGPLTDIPPAVREALWSDLPSQKDSGLSIRGLVRAPQAQFRTGSDLAWQAAGDKASVGRTLPVQLLTWVRGVLCLAWQAAGDKATV